jgi:hypothetical protein
LAPSTEAKQLSVYGANFEAPSALRLLSATAPRLVRSFKVLNELASYLLLLRPGEFRKGTSILAAATASASWL